MRFVKNHKKKRSKIYFIYLSAFFYEYIFKIKSTFLAKSQPIKPFRLKARIDKKS